VPVERWLSRPSLVEAGLLGAVLADPVSAPSLLRALLHDGNGTTRQTISDALTVVECGGRCWENTGDKSESTARYKLLETSNVDTYRVQLTYASDSAQRRHAAR
jgi:hypothetical protein